MLGRPPAIGAVADLIDEVRAYDLALVIQTVGQLEDSFDYEGMVAAKTEHIAVYQKILAAVRTAWPGQPLLALDAGCCDLCPTCTYPDEPCRHPDEAIPSVEATASMSMRCERSASEIQQRPQHRSYVGRDSAGQNRKNQGCDSMAADRAGRRRPSCPVKRSLILPERHQHLPSPTAQTC
jgi:hypothetical protein